MAGEHIELVRHAYALWNRGDVDGSLALSRPDVEVRLSGVFGDLPTLYRGHDGFREFWRNVREVWEDFHAQPERIIELDDERALVRIRFTGRGRGGIEVDRTFGHLWTVRKGRIVRLHSYAMWDEALEAVGMSE